MSCIASAVNRAQTLGAITLYTAAVLLMRNVVLQASVPFHDKALDVGRHVADGEGPLHNLRFERIKRPREVYGDSYGTYECSRSGARLAMAECEILDFSFDNKDLSFPGIQRTHLIVIGP